MKPNQAALSPRPNLNPGRFLFLGSILMAALLFAGCSKTGGMASGSNPAGVYTLVTVNAAKVPATLDHDGVKLEVRSGTFTINADGTCRSHTVFVPPAGPEVTREVKATYTQQGSKLDMQWEGAGMTTGSVEGNTFTMNNEGMVFSYRK